MKKQLFFITMLAIFGLSTKAQWLPTNGPYGVDIGSLAVNGNNIFASTGDGVFMTSDNGNNWNITSSIGSGNGDQVIITNGSDIFAGTKPISGEGGIYLSSNNGSSWTALNNGLVYPPNNHCYVSSLAISGNNIFAAGLSGEFFSSNYGSSWAQVNTGSSSYTFALAINGNNVFAGTGGDGVYLTSNNGNSWAQVNTGLSDLNIAALAISGNNIFAGTGNGVLISSNNGSSWSQTGLTSFDVNTLLINGSNIYAGTLFNGVYFSSNNGSSWTSLGLANRSIYSLAVNGGYLYTGTDSLVWKRAIPLGIEEINNKEINIGVYPNPAKANIIIETPLQSTIEISNIQGQLIKTLAASGTKTNIDVSGFPCGVYIVEVRTEKGVAVKRFIKE